MKQLASFNLILVFSMLFSCGDGNNEEKNAAPKQEIASVSIKTEIKEEAFVPEIIKGRVSKMLSAGGTAETSQIYFEYFLLNEKSPIYLKTVNELISKSVQNEFEETEIEKITSNLSKKYFADILMEFKKSFSTVDEEYMPWNLMDSIHIDDSKTNYVHLETYTYSFTGGAHGNGYESHYLIDKKTGKTLTTKDVFSSKKKLHTLIDSYFRKSVDLSPNESLQDAGWFIEGRLTANENFYFKDKKVVFVYNAYEIGPYAMGAPTVEIPLNKIQEIIKINLK